MTLRTLLSLGALATVIVAATVRNEARIDALLPSNLPAEVTADTHEPEHVETCEVVRNRLLARALDPQGSANTTEQEAVVRDVRMAAKLPGAAQGQSCAATVVLEIAASTKCGSGAELITSAVADADALDVDTVEQALSSRTDCARGRGQRCC